jgi:hypothetical protein
MENTKQTTVANSIEQTAGDTFYNKTEDERAPPIEKKINRDQNGRIDIGIVNVED